MSREDEILEKSKKDIERMLSKMIANKDEKIAELKAEILELRTVNSCDFEPISYATYIIDEYRESGRENWLDDICEIADYLNTYCDHHQFDVDDKEDDEN